MGLKEQITEVKEEVKKVKEQSFAMDLLKDYKNQNKRQFIIILVILSMWFISIGAFIYYINTTGYEETIETAETDNGGNACIGNYCNNGEISYGESK